MGTSGPVHDDAADVEVCSSEEEVSGETPIVVMPRGGAREVGRSCYQVETTNGRYLVDCGLKQGGGGQFPDFRGLEPESIDAVFLTHAHIDHTGGLPVLENNNLLSRNAKIICTQGTAALAHVLLHDSLKIHEEEARKPGHVAQFERKDVEDVLARFDPIDGYLPGEISDHIESDDALSYKLGDAAHLLGSSWLALETGGRRVVFSGDLGGRSAHLKDIEEPPGADTLILESTYGDRDTHSSFKSARNSVFDQAIQAQRNGIPVLIPTFAVGRAQEILQIFRERWRDLPEDVQDDLTIIFDGMAQEATDRYHAFASPTYLNESIMNYIQNAADFEPFRPEVAARPESGPDRERILNEGTTPIVVAPSGMLTGGLSPAYLVQLLADYEEIRVLQTGYQADGTLGRELSNASGRVEATVETRPIGELSIDDNPRISDVGDAGDAGREFEIRFPSSWVRSISGLSGHAARVKLLEFARHVDPTHTALVHGDQQSQHELISFLDGNLDTDIVTRASLHSPIPVYPPDVEVVATDPVEEAAHPQITITQKSEVDEDAVMNSVEASRQSLSDTAARDDNAGEDSGVDAERDEDVDVESMVETLEERVEAIDDELVRLRNDEQRSEADLRALIKDEVQQILEENR